MNANGAVRRTVLVAVGQIAVKGSQVVLAVGLVRLLSNEAWTTVAFLLSIYLAGVTLGTLNLHQSLVFFLPRIDREHRRSLVLRTQGMLAGVGLLFALVLFAVRGVIGSGTLRAAHLVPWIGLAIALELPAASLSSALIGVDRLRTAASWEAVSSLLQITFVIGAAIKVGSAQSIVFALVASAIVRVSLCAAATVVVFPTTRTRPPSGLVLSQLRYAVPLGLTLAVSVLNRSIDKWLVAAFAPRQLGSYAVAAQEIPVVTMLPYAGGVAVATQLVAAFHRNDLASARKVWVAQAATMSRAVVAISMAMIVVAPEAMHMVLGNDYRVGVLPFQFFSAITLHRVAEYGLALRAADRTKDLVSSALVLLSANVLLAGVGAWQAGAAGASAGTLAANVVAWLYALRLVARVFDCSVAQAFPWVAWSHALLGAALAAVISSMAVGAVTAEATAPLEVLVFKLLAFTLVYLTCLAALPRASRSVLGPNAVDSTPSLAGVAQ